MAYLSEAEPLRGVALPVTAGVRRIVAANPGPMTYHGTNSYLIETPGGVMILDPGPDDPEHLSALAAAAEGRATAILLSHGHGDHCAGAPRLRAMLDVPVYGYHDFAGRSAQPDIGLTEGQTIGGMTVLFTPGHARDHICLAREDGVVFTGDQVMAWSSSVVPHPGGSMVDFIDSLTRLADRNDKLYLCGHGPMLPDPSPFVRRLIHLRQRREASILQALRDGLTTASGITSKIYQHRDGRLLQAAEHNVRAHLAKLELDGRIRQVDGLLYPAD